MAFGLGSLTPDDFAAILRAAPPGAAAAPRRVPFGLDPAALGAAADGLERAAPTAPSFGLGSQMPDAPHMPPAQAPASPQREAPPASAPAPRMMTGAPLPPPRPAEFGASAADMPAPIAVPTSGNLPDPAGAPKAEEPSFLDGLMRGIQKTDGLLGSIGIGLLSTPGLGQGLGAGLLNYQQAGVQRAATNLAQAEFQLKQAKVASEAKSENATKAWLLDKGMDSNLADAAMGNTTVLQSVISQLNKDPSRVTIGGNIYELKHGEKPSEANLLGPAEPGVDVIRAKAQAQTEGAAAGKSEEPFNLSEGQTRYDASGKPIVSAPSKKPDGFDVETKLRGEFSKGLGTFNDVHEGYGRIIAATRQRETNPTAVSPASDMSLVFGFMKMLDPTSVVREGEYATAKNATGVPDQVRNAYNKAMNGEFLTPEQRQDFLGQAGELYGTARKGADVIAGRYRNLAGQYGVDPERTAFLPPAPEPPRVGPARAKQGSPDAGGAPLDVGAFRDAGGGVTIRRVK